MRPLLAASVTLAALLGLLPGTAGAAAGSLDKSFAGNGRLTIEATPEPYAGRGNYTRLDTVPMASAAAPEGELVAADSRHVFRYRADGRPQRRFGGNGRVTIPTPAGMVFELAGVAVDSKGRTLVAGTTRPPEPRFQAPPPQEPSGTHDARVSVYRFLPNGKLDAGFGVGGLAGDGLGAVAATGLAVDSRDRPVLTVVLSTTLGFCSPYAATPIYLNQAIVARLTVGGAPDPSFGDHGLYYGGSLEDASLPTLTRNGKTLFAAPTERPCNRIAEGKAPVISLVGAGGALLQRYPAAPDGNFEFIEVSSLAVDRHNRIVVLVTRRTGDGGGPFQEVRRLLPNGELDPHFGDGGVAGNLGPAEELLGAVTTDRHNRVVLAGSAPLRQGRGFVAMRLNAAGRPQTWFGDGGSTTIGFGRRAKAMASQVHRDSRGRIVLGGTVEAPWLSTGYGLAFTRLLN